MPLSELFSKSLKNLVIWISCNYANINLAKFCMEKYIWRGVSGKFCSHQWNVWHAAGNSCRRYVWCACVCRASMPHSFQLLHFMVSCWLLDIFARWVQQMSAAARRTAGHMHVSCVTVRIVLHSDLPKPSPKSTPVPSAIVPSYNMGLTITNSCFTVVCICLLIFLLLGLVSYQSHYIMLSPF